MVQINWDRILSVKAASLTDQEIEDLCPMVMNCDVGDVDDIDNLRTVMKLSQEILQYKDNQIESLLLECEDLKRKVSESRSSSSSKRKKSFAKDLVNSNTESHSTPRSIYDTDREKDEKIAILLSELEVMENENTTLKEKLRAMKQEMEEATEQMNSMTEELNLSKEKSTTYKDRLDEQEKKNNALLGQIQELTTQQLNRDQVIDEFSAAIDARVTEWKIILDEKDAEIAALRENLSQSLTHSVTSVRDENTSQIAHLRQMIDQRNETIEQLQSKLAEAVEEMNESTTLIEKLKSDSRKNERTSRRKEQKTLLRKLQESSDKILNLENTLSQAEREAEIRSKELCEALAALQKFENGEYGLAEAIEELKETKKLLSQRDKHIQELIEVINKMEKVNSRQEMQIVTLCEKVNLPPDGIIPIDGIMARHAAEMRIAEENRRDNETLKRENTELRSEVRTLKFRMKNLPERVIVPSHATDDVRDATLSSKVSVAEHDWITERETLAQRHMMEVEDIKDNVRIVVEENEALRRGMHEILDSIRDQDGNCSVVIQSETLEKLLEALDVRHLAGWYHPAMRLQSRLNVVQGSNSELRTQLKQIRSELQKKDEILQHIVLAKCSNENRTNLVSEHQETSLQHAGSELPQESYENERAEWQKERNSLYEEKNELEDAVTRLEVQLEEYERNWKMLESGDDEARKLFAERCKDSAESAVQIVVLNRKCKILEELLSKESDKIYKVQKLTIAEDTERKRKLIELEKQKKILEGRIATLESNLNNSVSMLEFDEMREKYNDACVRLRTVLEDKPIFGHEMETLEAAEVGPHQGQGDSQIPLSNLRSGDLMSRNSEAIETRTSIKDKLNEIQRELIRCSRVTGTSESRELEERVEVLEAENDSLRKTVDATSEEAQAYAAQNFLKTFEMESLRHQLLDLQSTSEDKETIARLGFELTNCKLLEAETSRQKVSLRTEISHLEKENEILNRRCEDSRRLAADYQKQCAARCRIYVDLVDFLRRQYADATPLTSLERFESALTKLNCDRLAIDEALKEALKKNENIQAQQDVLTDRLEVVEQLKDILEQQIGSPDVREILQRFSETSQSLLGELRHKRQITRLENELQVANDRVAEGEAVINAMEIEMVFVQKLWSKPGTQGESPIEPSAPARVEIDTASTWVQVSVENRSVGVQTDAEAKSSPTENPISEETWQGLKSRSVDETNHRAQSVLNEKLNQALSLAADRSTLLIKYESQIAEYQAKIVALNKLVETNRNPEAIEVKKFIETNTTDVDTSDRIVLKSTINSLQKLISQKEETISRYQNLLKEDRDEHSKAAVRFQEEIKALQSKLSNAQEEMNQKISEYIRSPEPVPQRRGAATPDWNKNIDLEEEVEKLNEQVSTLQADLNIARELSERWKRLAEERLKHMDHMREKLEEQHKNELESYRAERDKWQTEADTLRQQLSDNRMLLAKGNSLLTKKLQERENKIHELDIAYQQLQNEFEVTGTTSQPSSAHSSKMQEMGGNFAKVQSNQLQAQLDLTRKQVQALMEKEKTYKSQIVDLKQQLSRTYMATKTHDQKISQRESQLERKTRALEDELHATKLELEREKFAHETKRLKTAEELALWDKQKRWQQTAEKFREKFTDKNEECKKLQANYEKLRGVVSCMEREKWYLRSKLRCENGCLTARPRAVCNANATQDLREECLALRARVRELVDRLEVEDAAQLVAKVDEQRRHILALETVAKGNEYVVDQLERLEATRDVLEKNNLRLEGENLELRLEIERMMLETPRLREKVKHLEKYVELLKVEKSSESSPRSSEKESQDPGKRSTAQLEKTVFTLKRIVEKLQADNKRLRLTNNEKRAGNSPKSGRSDNASTSQIRASYERAQQRVVALETDLQLAEQRISMLENSAKEEANGSEIGMLKHQLAHKSELLDKVKQLLTRAAINEKAMRQKLQMLEAKQSLETIPECVVSPPTPDE